ncbi:peter Pan-like protein [Andrographis paniculata]|uniref:peter Pan-like protein n=1 Tax=Andrographis paniculata TaxID=175694 RepID=UPI0021E95661|nr:peter Pan-like protein [Andrographis paniculata]
MWTFSNVLKEITDRRPCNRGQDTEEFCVFSGKVTRRSSKIADGFKKIDASIGALNLKCLNLLLFVGKNKEQSQRIFERDRPNGCYILSKTDSAPYLRVGRTPQGPTLTFKILEYSLVAYVVKSQLRPGSHKDLFDNPPLIVLSGFGTGEQHLRLTTIMFQNMFPAIDINTVKLSSCQRIVLLNYNKDTKHIDFRHYSIRLQPAGVSRRIRKFVQSHQAPDLRTLQDVSDYLTKAGYGSESEVDDESATVSLPMDLGRVKIRHQVRVLSNFKKLDLE